MDDKENEKSNDEAMGDGRSTTWSWSEASESRGSYAKEEIGELPEILPDVVLGWLLLHKSGLDAGERATVLATTRNKLNFDVIETALRSVWTESDLRNRDHGRGRETRVNMANAVYFGADAETWQSDSETEEPESEEDESEDEEIAEEETEAYVAAQRGKGGDGCSTENVGGSEKSASTK